MGGEVSYTVPGLAISLPQVQLLRMVPEVEAAYRKGEMLTGELKKLSIELLQ